MWLYNSYRCCLPSWNGFCCNHSATELSFSPSDCAALASILKYRTFLRYYILCPLQWIYRWTFWEECPSHRHHKESLLFPNIQQLIWQCSYLQRENSSIGNHSSSTLQIYFSYSKPVSLSFLNKKRRLHTNRQMDTQTDTGRERERPVPCCKREHAPSSHPVHQLHCASSFWSAAHHSAWHSWGR